MDRSNDMSDREASLQLYREILRAYNSGNLKEFTRLLHEHPEQLRSDDDDLPERWIHDAARDGALPFVQALVELGLSIDEPEFRVGHICHEPVGPIRWAAGRGQLEVVRWLLEQGARVNVEVDGERRCPPLHAAATGGRLDVVKLLVKHGADVHATNQGVNAITQAWLLGRGEVYEYLHSLGTRPLVETTPPDIPGGHARMIERMTNKYGPLGDWTFEIPVDPPVVVHTIPANEQYDDAHTLVTIGLSDRPLRWSWNPFIWRELEMWLSPQWPLSPAALADPRWNWPFAWLEQFVTDLRSGGKWPGSPCLYPNEPTNEPLGEGTDLCGWLFVQHLEEWINLPDHRSIGQFTFFPIYAEERELAEREGERPLLWRFRDAGVPLHVVSVRENVAL